MARPSSRKKLQAARSKREAAKRRPSQRKSAPKRPMGLRLRRRQGAGPRRHEGPARRQGRQPRRDGQPRPAGAAGLHHHHRGLHPLLRQQADIPEGPGEAGRRRPRPHRQNHRPQVRRPRQPAAGLRPLRRARLDARHDGHRAQPRPQRRDRRGAGAAVRRPALRLRQLPPLHPDVFQRGARHRASQLRGHPRGPQGARRHDARHRAHRRRLGRRRRALPGARPRGEGRAVPAGPARRSSGARSARCSARG